MDGLVSPESFDVPDETHGFDFPEEVRDDVEGLIWLGYLEDSFEFCGHSFVIRTLRGDEELLAGLVTKEYIETMGQSRAWAWAQVALALVAVDGDDTFCPPTSSDKKAYARARFQYVTSKWFWPVGEYLFRRHADLLVRQAEAVQAVEDFMKGSLDMFTPSVGSSTDKGDSEVPEPPEENIQDLLD